jgi:hypothetical protein
MISSPPAGFDGLEYASNEDCSWYIIPQNENSSVHIVFHSFGTESCCDNLDIYSDQPTYNTPVARYNGKHLPYDSLYKGPLRLHFSSDSSITDKGFNLSYSIVEGVAPRFLSLENDLIAVEGDEVILPCRVTGIPQPTVTWYKDGLDVHLVLQSKFILRGNDLVIKDLEEEDSGFFTCRAENHLNYTEQILQLTVNVPPSILVHPTSIHLDSIFTTSGSYFPIFYNRSFYDTSNGSVQAVFRCEVYGNPRPEVYWKKDGKELYNPSTFANWLVISYVTISDTGLYSCLANSSVGSKESTAASLTIGNVVPCCLLLRLSWLAMPFAGENTLISLRYSYGWYNLLQMMVTKDGHDNNPGRLEISNSSYGKEIKIHFRNMTPSDTGVYGFHLILSPILSEGQDKVSFYVPIQVQVRVPPRLTVRPSDVTLRDCNPLHISCSAYSPWFSPLVSWSKDNVNIPVLSKSIIVGSRLTRAYLTVNNTPDVLTHYSCEAGPRSPYDEASSRATVSVVLRVEEGGWSWWMETLPCSVTCGFTRGIRLRSRRCYNDTVRCPGDSFQIISCYSTLIYCPSESNTSSEARTGKRVLDFVPKIHTYVTGTTDGTVV